MKTLFSKFKQLFNRKQSKSHYSLTTLQDTPLTFDDAFLPQFPNNTFYRLRSDIQYFELIKMHDSKNGPVMKMTLVGTEESFNIPLKWFECFFEPVKFDVTKTTSK